MSKFNETDVAILLDITAADKSAALSAIQENLGEFTLAEVEEALAELSELSRVAYNVVASPLGGRVITYAMWGNESTSVFVPPGYPLRIRGAMKWPSEGSETFTWVSAACRHLTSRFGDDWSGEFGPSSIRVDDGPVIVEWSGDDLADEARRKWARFVRANEGDGREVIFFNGREVVEGPDLSPVYRISTSPLRPGGKALGWNAPSFRWTPSKMGETSEVAEATFVLEGDLRPGFESAGWHVMSGENIARHGDLGFQVEDPKEAGMFLLQYCFGDGTGQYYAVEWQPWKWRTPRFAEGGQLLFYAVNTLREEHQSLLERYRAERAAATPTP